MRLPLAQPIAWSLPAVRPPHHSPVMQHALCPGTCHASTAVPPQLLSGIHDAAPGGKRKGNRGFGVAVCGGRNSLWTLGMSRAQQTEGTAGMCPFRTQSPAQHPAMPCPYASSQGAASPFHAHITSMPSSHDCPFAWSEAEFSPLLETGGQGVLILRDACCLLCMAASEAGVLIYQYASASRALVAGKLCATWHAVHPPLLTYPFSCRRH